MHSNYCVFTKGSSSPFTPSLLMTLAARVASQCFSALIVLFIPALRGFFPDEYIKNHAEFSYSYRNSEIAPRTKIYSSINEFQILFIRQHLFEFKSRIIRAVQRHI